MTSLRLVAIDASVLAVFRESPAAMESCVEASLGPAAESVRQALEQTALFLAARPCDPAWGCFLAVDDSTSQVVGTCAYKSGPCADGSVEVAYQTFPPFEGRGYATGMAAELVTRSGPRRVLAHTLPERNASCRVLEKAGFVWAGEVTDPEDGLVWRWVADAEHVNGPNSQ